MRITGKYEFERNTFGQHFWQITPTDVIEQLRWMSMKRFVLQGKNQNYWNLLKKHSNKNMSDFSIFRNAREEFIFLLKITYMENLLIFYYIYEGGYSLRIQLNFFDAIKLTGYTGLQTSLCRSKVIRNELKQYI